MTTTRLDLALLGKLVKKTRKKPKYVREQISKRAAKLGIASEAAQILWAKEFGIGTAAFQRRLGAHVQEQVRSGLPHLFATPVSAKTERKGTGKSTRHVSPLRAAIDYLLDDDELKRRCGDLLTARGSFDRVFREATTVLDHRLKKLAQIKGHMQPADLVAKVLHPNKAILVISDHESEQEGFFNICKGLMAAFRNPTHHALDDRLTREDALRFCGFIAALLAILARARVNLPPATS